MSRFAFDRLNEIVPDPATNAQPPAKEVDAVGARHGFTSREPMERMYKNEGSKEATVPLSIRPPLSVANRFIAFCKQHRYSYWEGLEELMKHRGI
jgi:hypothetical protein